MARRQTNGNTSSDLAAQQQVAAANRQLQWIYYYQQAIVAALNASGNNLADAVAAAAAATSYNSNISNNILNHSNNNNTSNSINTNETRSIYNNCNNGNSSAPSTNGLPTTTSNIFKQQFDQASLNLLESLYAMNNEPEDDAIEMIAHRLRADTFDVSNWFRARREAVASSVLLARLTGVNSSVPTLDVGGSEPVYNHNNQKMIDPLEAFFMHNDSQEPAAIDMVSRRINPAFSHPAPCNAQPTAIPSSSLLAKLNAVTSRSTLDIGSSEQLDNYHHSQKSIDPLEAFFRYNDNQEPAAIDMISKRINTQFSQSAPCKAQPPAVPSSSLLAKLNAVTSRPALNVVATKLDQKMIDLLEAFFLINDNPEPAAIEMIAKRINASADAINNWFDKKRLKLNPNAGPRSPPVKKREGGRVVTFSEYQRSLLEAIFDENNYLHPQEYEELSNLIQVPSRNIKIWFKNRRSKQRLSGRIATPCSANNSD